MFWTHQEGSEHGDGRQKVPDVVIVEEGEQDTLTVVFARLRGGFLETQIDQISLHTGDARAARVR